MDRFKFRAWDKGFRRWVESFAIDMEGVITSVRVKDLKDGEWFSDQIILCQCTGLKDKNGKLIYEGDILEETVGPQKEKRLHSVEWSGNMWDVRGQRGGLVGWMYDDGFATGDHGYFHFEETEVIGNIYENPELIEAEKKV